MFCWLRSLKDVLPPDITKTVYNALVLPHSDYCSVVWQECTKDLRMKIERVQNYGMRIILSQPPRTPSRRLRDKLKWMTLERRREMRRLALVRRCVMKEAPHCLNERLTATAKFGSQVTRGHDHNKLFVPQVSTEWYRNHSLSRGVKNGTAFHWRLGP